MSDSIFRKKNLDRLNSPDDLNSYLQIQTPSIWFGLTAILLILCGVIVWGVIAKLDTTADAVILSANGQAVCYVSEEDSADIEEGTAVRIDKDEYSLGAPVSQAVKDDTVMDEYMMHLGDLEAGEYVYAYSVNGSIADGSYACKVVLDSVSPASFLFSSSN